MKRLLLLVTTLMVLASACSPTPRSTLDRNRSLWDSQGIRHYSYELTITCFCVFRDQMPLTIEVRDGEVVSMTGANGADISEFRETYDRFATVEKLFDTIDNAIARPADVLEVEYDPTYGYPVSIHINPDLAAVDGSDQYDVANFQILP